MQLTPHFTLTELTRSTTAQRLTLGSLIVLWLDLHEELISGNPVATLLAIMAIGGVLFSAGLPGWALVRAVFNSIRKREGHGIEDIAREVKNGL